jgi:hypothetical protein
MVTHFISLVGIAGVQYFMPDFKLIKSLGLYKIQQYVVTYSLAKPHYAEAPNNKFKITNWGRPPLTDLEPNTNTLRPPQLVRLRRRAILVRVSSNPYEANVSTQTTVECACDVTSIIIWD